MSIPIGTFTSFEVTRGVDGGQNGLRVEWTHDLGGTPEPAGGETVFYAIIIKGSDYVEGSNGVPTGYLQAHYPGDLYSDFTNVIVTIAGIGNYISHHDYIITHHQDNLSIVWFSDADGTGTPGYKNEGSIFITQSALEAAGGYPTGGAAWPYIDTGPGIFDSMVAGIYAVNSAAEVLTAGATVPEYSNPIWVGDAALKWEKVEVVRPHDWSAGSGDGVTPPDPLSLEDILSADNMSCELVEPHAFNRRAALVKVEMLSKLDSIRNNKDLITGAALTGTDPLPDLTTEYFADDTDGHRKHKLFLNNITSIANRHAMYVENNPVYRANISWAHWTKTASDLTKTGTSDADSVYVAGEGAFETQHELTPDDGALPEHRQDNVDGYKYLEKLFSDDTTVYDKLDSGGSVVGAGAGVTPGATTNLSNLYCGQPAHVTIDCVNIVGTGMDSTGDGSDDVWVPCATEGIDPKYTGGQPVVDVHFRVHIPKDARGLSAASDKSNFAVFWKLVPKNSASWTGATIGASTPPLPTDYVFEDLLYDFNSKTLRNGDRVDAAVIATGATGYMPIGNFTKQPAPDDPYGPSYLPYGDAETWVGTATINLASDATARHTVWEAGAYASGVPRLTPSGGSPNILGDSVEAIANREFIIATVLIDISNENVYTPWKETGRNEYSPAYYKEFSLDAPTAVGIDIEPQPADLPLPGSTYGVGDTGADTLAYNIEFPAATFHLVANGTYAWGDYASWGLEAAALGDPAGANYVNTPNGWIPPYTFSSDQAPVDWSVVASSLTHPTTGVALDLGGTLDDVGTDGPIATLSPGGGYAAWEDTQPSIGVTVGDFDDGIFKIQATRTVGLITHTDTFTMALQDQIVIAEFDVYAADQSSALQGEKWVLPVAAAGPTGLTIGEALEWGKDEIQIGNKDTGLDSGLNKGTNLYDWAGEGNPHGDSSENAASQLYSGVDPDGGSGPLDIFLDPDALLSSVAIGNGLSGEAAGLIIPKYKKATDIIPGSSGAWRTGGKIVTYNVIVDDNPGGDYDPVTHQVGAPENELAETGQSKFEYGTQPCYAFPPAKVATLKVTWAAAIFDNVALDYWTGNGSTPTWDIYAKRTLLSTRISTTGPTFSGTPSPISVTDDNDVVVSDVGGTWYLTDSNYNNITITTNFSAGNTPEFLGLRGYVIYGDGASSYANQHEMFNWYVDGVLTGGSPSIYYNHYFYSDDPDSSKTIICKHVLADGLTESNGTVGTDWTQTVKIIVEQTCDQDAWKNFEAFGSAGTLGDAGVRLHWWLGDTIVFESPDNINISISGTPGSMTNGAAAGPVLGSLDWDDPSTPTQGPDYGSLQALLATEANQWVFGNLWSVPSPYATHPDNADSIMVRSPDYASAGYHLGAGGNTPPGRVTWSWLGDTMVVDPLAWDQPTSVTIEWKTVGVTRRRYNTDPSTLPELAGGFSISALNTLLNTGFVYYDASNHAGYVVDGTGAPIEGNDYKWNKGEIRVNESKFASISAGDAATLLIPEFGDAIELEGDITITKTICGHTYTDVVPIGIMLYNWVCDNWNEYSKFDLHGTYGVTMPDGGAAAFPSYLENSIEIGNTPSGASFDAADSFKVLPSGWIRLADPAGDVTLQSGGTAGTSGYLINPDTFGIESSHVTFEWYGLGWEWGNDGYLPGGAGQENAWKHISWIGSYGGSVKRIFATGGTNEPLAGYALSASAISALDSLVTYDDATNSVTYSAPSFSSESAKQAFFDALSIPDWKDEGTYYGAAVVTYHPCMDGLVTYRTSYPRNDPGGNPDPGPIPAHQARVPIEIIVVNSQCNAAWWGSGENGFQVLWADSGGVTTTNSTLGVTIADGSGNNILTITGDENVNIRIYDDPAATTYHDPFHNVSGGPLSSQAPPLNLDPGDFVFTWGSTPAADAYLLTDSVLAYAGPTHAHMGRSTNGLWNTHLDGMCHWEVLEELLSWNAGLANENSTVTYTAMCTLSVDVCGTTETDNSATVEFAVTNALGDATSTSNWHNWGFNISGNNDPYLLDGEYLGTGYPLPVTGADNSVDVASSVKGVCLSTTVGDAADAPIATAIDAASGTASWLPSSTANDPAFAGGAATTWTSGKIGGATVTDQWNLASSFKNMTGKIWVSEIVIHGDLDGNDEGLSNVTIGGHNFGSFVRDGGGPGVDTGTSDTGAVSGLTSVIPTYFDSAYVDIVNGIVDYGFTVGVNTGYLGLASGQGNTHAWHMTVSFDSPAVAQGDDHSDWVKICREINGAVAPQGDAGSSSAAEGTGTNGEDLAGDWVYIEDFLKFDGADPDSDHNAVSIVWWGDNCYPCAPSGDVYGGDADDYSTLVRATLNQIVGWDWSQASGAGLGPLKVDDLTVGAPKINGGGVYSFVDLYQILENLGFDPSSTDLTHPAPIGSVKRFFGWIKVDKRCLGTNSTNDGSGVHDQVRFLPIRVDIKHALVDPFRCDYWLDTTQGGPDFPVGSQCNLTLGDWIASGNSTHTGLPPVSLHPLLYAPPSIGQHDVSDPDWGSTEDYGVTPQGPGGVMNFPYHDSDERQLTDGLLPVLIVKRLNGRTTLDEGLVHIIVWIDLRGSLHPARTLIQKLENVFIDEGLWDGAGSGVPWGGTSPTYGVSPTAAEEVYHTGTSLSTPPLVQEHPANCYGVQWFLLCNVWTCGKPGINFKHTSGGPDVELGLIPGLTGQYPSRTHIGYKTFHPRGIQFDADGDGTINLSSTPPDWESPEYAEHSWMMPHSHYIPSYLIAPASLDGTGQPITTINGGGWKDYAPTKSLPSSGDLPVWGRLCQLPSTMGKNFVAGGTDDGKSGSFSGEHWIGYQELEKDMRLLWTEINVAFATVTKTAEALSPCCPCANLSALGEDPGFGTGDLLNSAGSTFVAGQPDWTTAATEGDDKKPDSICYRIVLDVGDTGFYPSTTSMSSGYGGYPTTSPGVGLTWVWDASSNGWVAV